MALRLAQAAAAPSGDPVPPAGAAGSGGTGNGERLGFSARRFPLPPPLRTHPPQENNKLPQHGGYHHLRRCRHRPRTASWDGGGPVPPLRGGRAASSAVGYTGPRRSVRVYRQRPLRMRRAASCPLRRSAGRECACVTVAERERARALGRGVMCGAMAVGTRSCCRPVGPQVRELRRGSREGVWIRARGLPHRA